MIPAEFDYVAPESLDDALAALREGGEDAKLLAGGHSLLPLMKLRLAAPTLLVDLRRVPGLSGIRRDNGAFRIGAMTVHHAVASHPYRRCSGMLVHPLSGAAGSDGSRCARHCIDGYRFAKRQGKPNSAGKRKPM